MFSTEKYNSPGIESKHNEAGKDIGINFIITKKELWNIALSEIIKMSKSFSETVNELSLICRHSFMIVKLQAICCSSQNVL